MTCREASCYTGHMPTSTVDIGTLIVRDPALHDGKPCLAGTGTTVKEIIARHQRGLSVADILATAPHLDAQRIHAALAYYFANRNEIDMEFEADDALYDRLEAASPAAR